MNVLYEEDGGFKVATIMTEQAGSLQVEAPHGKRSKIKASHVLLSFPEPSAARLMPEAEALSHTLDIEFLWECAPQSEVTFQAFGQEYFGHAPSAVEAAALLLKLHGSPVYFHRKGRGNYRAAPPDILKAALAAVERKRLQAEQQAQWVCGLLKNEPPEQFVKQAAYLLMQPDKNTMEYKALHSACEQSGKTPQQLLIDCGAFTSAHDLHRACFEVEQFPRGVGFPVVPVPTMPDLPLADVQAFSIDDITTTEIDDAFSVSWQPDGTATIGIHIAAPGLLVQRGDVFDLIARERLSTVYMPGEKITMMPDALVNVATLAAGQAVPSLSLYFNVNIATGCIEGEPQTRIEKITIASNLRHNHLDGVVTVQALEHIAHSLPADATSNATKASEPPWPHANELALLWKVSRVLSGVRDQVRGKPEQNHRIDYSFYVDDGVVRIEPRRRDAPLDLLVAEFMILANQTWGGMLDRAALPGIYRAQAPMGRVRMTTHAAPHAGLGVPYYAWFTSPLRRYVDLVNQWQILALVQQTAAPFAPKDSELFAVVSAFDASYKAYADFQSRMERYWCLKWLEQNNVKQVLAVVLREEIVRLADIPLTIRVLGMAPQLRGTQLRLDIIGINFVSLELDCRLIEILAQPLLEQEDDDPIDTPADVAPVDVPVDALPAVPAADEGIAIKPEGRPEGSDG